MFLFQNMILITMLNSIDSLLWACSSPTVIMHRAERSPTLYVKCKATFTRYNLL